MVLSGVFSNLLFCCSLVAQSCLTLYDPVDCSTPGFPVHHQLPGITQTPSSQWCHPIFSFSVIPFSSCLRSFPASGSFPISQFFSSGGQRIGVSALASVLPKNIQDWFPLDWLIGSPYSPRDSQESSPTPQFKSINSSVLSFLHSPTLTSIHLRVFFSTAIWKHQILQCSAFFIVQLLHPYMTIEKIIALTT